MLGVLLFHAGYLHGGFLGVDLFFVLSGFLVTGLLLADAEVHGGVRLGRFYARRLRRLAPELLVVLAAVGVLSPLLFDREELAPIRDSGVATLLYVANWHDVAEARDYWAQSGANPFDHMWSLSIEEQVYVVWPLAVVAVIALSRRRRSRWPPHRTVLVLAASLGTLSLVALAAAHRPGGDTARAYYGTDTRSFAVLAGAVVAAGLRAPRVRSLLAGPVGRTAAVVGTAVLGVAWVALEGTDSILYEGLLPVLGILAAVIVGSLAVGRGGALAAVLELGPLVGLGLVSYGLYLWHWPVYVVIDADRVGFGGLGLACLRIGVSLALALASYRFVEHPVRTRVRTARWRAALPAGVAAASAGLLLGTAGAVTPPSGEFGDSASAGIHAPPDGRPRLLLLGDSQAFELAHRAGGNGYERFQVASSTFLGCGIGPGLPVSTGVAVTESLVGERCDEVLDTWRGAMRALDPDHVLVHVGAWEVLDRRVGDEDLAFGTQTWDAATAARLHEVAAALGAGGVPVVWLAAPCFSPDEELGHPDRDDDERVARWNELLRAEAGRLGQPVLPYDDYTCEGPASDDDLDGVDFRRDGVHLTAEAAPLVWTWVADQLGAGRG